MNIPLLVSKYRETHRMTQEDLGKKLGTSQTWVSSVERGQLSVNQMRPEHRGALLGLLGYQAKLHRRNDSGIATVHPHPSIKDIPMGFQLFKPERFHTPKDEMSVRITTGATISLSRAIMEMMGIEKRRHHELMWDGQTHQIAIRILPVGETTEASRVIGTPGNPKGGNGLIVASKFFHTFRIQTPSKTLKLVPKLASLGTKDDTLIVDYPEILVADR